MTPQSQAELGQVVADLAQGHALLQQRVTTGMDAVSNQLASLNAEVRELTRVATQVSVQQSAMEGHSEGLTRAFVAIKELAEATSARFDVARGEHEKTHSQVLLWRGVVLGVLACGTLLVASSVYFIQSQFDTARAERVRIEAMSRDYDARLDALEQRNRL